jgi:hypothetical protein
MPVARRQYKQDANVECASSAYCSHPDDSGCATMHGQGADQPLRIRTAVTPSGEPNTTCASLIGDVLGKERRTKSWKAELQPSLATPMLKFEANSSRARLSINII